MKYLLILCVVSVSGCFSVNDSSSKRQAFQDACENLSRYIHHATFEVPINSTDLICVANIKYKHFEKIAYIHLDRYDSYQDVVMYSILSKNAEEFYQHYIRCKNKFSNGLDVLLCVEKKQDEILNRTK